MQADDADEHEGQQVVQREEAVQRRIVDRIAAPQQDGDAVADVGDGREQRGDDGRAPEGHLAPRQHVAHEGGGHHQQEDDDAEDPEDFARRLVGPVVEATEHVDIDGDEEHRSAVGMRIAHQPAPVHVAHDVLDGVEGVVHMRRVVHHEHDAGDDLRHQHEAQDTTEGPPVIEVTRRRVDDEGRVDEPHDGKPALEPPAEGALGNVSGRTAHVMFSCRKPRAGGVAREKPRDQPIVSLVSEAKV